LSFCIKMRSAISRLITICGLFLCVSGVEVAFAGDRTYEMVSPPYKGGYGATEILAVAPDGERVVSYSLGTFADAPSGLTLPGYLGYRSGSGWGTAPLMPPANIAPEVDATDYSSTLESALTEVKPGPNTGVTTFVGNETQLLLHSSYLPDTEADWMVLGGVRMKSLDSSEGSLGASPIYAGADDRLCHVLINSEAPLLSATIGTEGSQLYEAVAGCESEPGLRLVGLDNSRKILSSTCGIGPGPGGNTEDNAFNAISEDGRTIFFSGCIGAKAELFARLDGTRTIEISKPLGGCGDGGKPLEVPGEVPCPGAATRGSAIFVGANQTGTMVYFTTNQSLVNDDQDSSNDLYMARLECPGGGDNCEVAAREVTGIVQVSHDPNAAEAAEVAREVLVAPDGARAYFVASGVLSNNVNSEGFRALSGADNLYVYDSQSNETTFVTDLCSGPAKSGIQDDSRCPLNLEIGEKTRNDSRLWLSPGAREGETGGAAGRFLVFASYGQLVSSDTDTAQDIYRYDAMSGSLDRVSLGEAGSDGNGNSDEFDATLMPSHEEEGRVLGRYKMASRSISEDGSRIVFKSPEPLSQMAINHLENVYEWDKEPDWREGRVTLISSGTDEQSVDDVVMSASGKDIFFVTASALASQDIDDAQDVYDASLEGGPTPTPVGPESCSDACQGALTSPAPLLAPGSAVQSPGGNFTTPRPTVKVAKKGSRRTRKKHRRKLKRRTKLQARSGRSRS
jgi:hypothetical protein